MILASVLNEAGCSTSSVVLSKSTVHRHRQRCRQDAAQKIKKDYHASKCVVHWDSKLVPDNIQLSVVDRLPVVVTSLNDGTTKLLAVPKLSSGTGQEAANNVTQQLASWNLSEHVIGMCFDTTASNTGKAKGACTLLENTVKRNLLWLACRHHMFEVLLSDAFNAAFQIPSSGPEIQLFKRFKNSWHSINHVPKKQQIPLILPSDELKTFITEQLSSSHARDDYKELLTLSALLIGLDVTASIHKPGAIHRARWMAKAIYTLKIELLLSGNEAALNLSASELQGVRVFNRFIICIYIQSWFTSRSAVDAPVNDTMLIQRLNSYTDDRMRIIGLKMMKRHSWYLSPELATLALFSQHLSSAEKSHIVSNAQSERGSHTLTALPQNVRELKISRSFFKTAQLDDSFLQQPVDQWSESQSFMEAMNFVKNLPSVNDCAERGVARINDTSMQ